ncbi:DUF1129 family protein [Listeria booriae]|uniref:DUF1129 family protein n=1 Tax=Listeria booriae TaxID=1552123 RepID=UPI00164CF838|nr:DUF1129 family protein [Listeria booriae]MBC6128261.1 DUF1129 family protein [Listeria booriae]
MLTKKQLIQEKSDQLTEAQQAYIKTVEWVVASDKNIAEHDKEEALLKTIERLLEAKDVAPEETLGMDATTYARQLTHKLPDVTQTNQIPLFVFIGTLIMSAFLVVMGIIHFINKDHVFYVGTFVVSILLVFICIVCMLVGGYILWKHYTVTAAKSIAAYFLIGSGILIMYVFVLVFLLMILPNFGKVISSGALIELILGVAGFITATIIWRKI